LPLVGWPLSFVGLAYFESMLVGWVVARGDLPKPLRAVMWVGAAGSLVLLAALFTEGHLCVYCLVVHVANLAWVGLAEGQRIASRQTLAIATSATGPLTSFGATLTCTALAVWSLQSYANAASQAEVITAVEASLEPGCRSEQARALHGEETVTLGPGRYWLGPPDAAHRLVVVSDYECPSCRRIHLSLQSLMARRNDLAISARHFPLCTDCNAQVGESRHQNACRAARAAEAAGLLGGSDTFWQMHDWLFRCHGKFTAAELDAAATELGLTLAEFHETMAGEQVTVALESDVRAAHTAGLQFTPMMFLDGAHLSINTAEGKQP
jgi:protein-disulfide isomerase